MCCQKLGVIQGVEADIQPCLHSILLIENDASHTSVIETGHKGFATMMVMPCLSAKVSSSGFLTWTCRLYVPSTSVSQATDQMIFNCYTENIFDHIT